MITLAFVLLATRSIGLTIQLLHIDKTATQRAATLILLCAYASAEYGLSAFL